MQFPQFGSFFIQRQCPDRLSIIKPSHLYYCMRTKFLRKRTLKNRFCVQASRKIGKPCTYKIDTNFMNHRLWPNEFLQSPFFPLGLIDEMRVFYITRFEGSDCFQLSKQKLILRQRIQKMVKSHQWHSQKGPVMFIFDSKLVAISPVCVSAMSSFQNVCDGWSSSLNGFFVEYFRGSELEKKKNNSHVVSPPVESQFSISPWPSKEFHQKQQALVHYNNLLSTKTILPKIIIESFIAIPGVISWKVDPHW